MYLFLDTEFTDFKDCDLISLGAISEDGRHEFYVEITDHKHEWQSDFVREAVVPLLDNKRYGQTFNEACVSLCKWIEELPKNKITFIVDYTGDAMLLGDLLSNGGPYEKEIMVDLVQRELTSHLHKLGFHHPQELHKAYRAFTVNVEGYFKNVDPNRHHALVDAKALRYGWLKGIDCLKRS